MGISGEVMRIDKELADLIRRMETQNEMNQRQASKEIAKIAKRNSNETKVTREIKF